MSEDKIERWVLFSLALLANDPGNYVRLKDALALLTLDADMLYPFLQGGQPVTLAVDAIAEVMEPLPPEVQGGFRDLTGDILFTGVDGPRAAGEVMQQTLKLMFDALLRDAEEQESPIWRAAEQQ